MYDRLNAIYDALSEGQRLAIGIIGVGIAMLPTIGIVACVAYSVLHFLGFL